MSNQAKPCRQCGSTDNGYFTPKSRTCRKCTSQKLMIVMKETANRHGFKNYYQYSKFKNFNKNQLKTA